jgi:hypothetical protein
MIWIYSKIVNGERGFKVMLGGGLGSQPAHAELLSIYSSKPNYSNYGRGVEDI